MHLPTLLSLVTVTGTLGFPDSAPANNTRLIDLAAFSAPIGNADINLDELAKEEITKRTAMTYCANQQSTSGKLAIGVCPVECSLAA